MNSGATRTTPTRDDPVTAAFAENMEDFIQTHPIDLWIHGHTHHGADYRIGNCRIVSNQRGYPDQPAADFRPDWIVAV